MENIALQSLQTVVLRVEIATNLGSKMVAICTRNTNEKQYSQFANFARLYFPYLQHLATKFCNFTTFERFFPGISFFCLDLPSSKISL